MHVYLCKLWDKTNLCILLLTLTKPHEKILFKLKLFQSVVQGEYRNVHGKVWKGLPKSPWSELGDVGGKKAPRQVTETEKG